MFAKMLLCLDGSSPTEQLLSYTAGIAQRFRSQVILLHVTRMPSSLATASAPGIEDIIQREQWRLLAEAHRYLGEIRAQLESKGLSAEAVVVEGTPGDAIVHYAESSACELILVAARRRGNISQIVFGSVADHVVRNATVPVLTVGPIAQEQSRRPAMSGVNAE